MKQLPNLIDLSEMKKEIQETLFQRYSIRVNLILGILFMLCLSIFIYIGFKTKESVNKEDKVEDENDMYDDIPPPNLYTYNPVDYISNTVNLALMS